MHLWIGAFDCMDPPAAIEVKLGSVAVALVEDSGWRRIRDGEPSRGRNYVRTCALAVSGRDTPYRVSIECSGQSIEVATRTLPLQVPRLLEGTFNILLCSCYYQPEDAGGLLSTIVSQIMVRPHLTLMLGDQIYGDLPLMPPASASDIRAKLGEKYRKNWASAAFGTAGLANVLRIAPTVCVADDHEFWNNFPFRQAQLPLTWTAAGQAAWEGAAKELYEDYQTGSQGQTANRIDVDPLKLLVLDTRTGRDRDFQTLLDPVALEALNAWTSDLIAAKASGAPCIGMLASGQALFVTPAPGARRYIADAEMANYAQFRNEVLPLLESLTDAGIPVLYITGDVHWGRVATAVDLRTNRYALYEVITSPSRLLGAGAFTRVRDAMSQVGKLFGIGTAWPRHDAPADVPDRFGSGGRFQLICDPDTGSGFRQRGDQVAMLSFSRSGQGVSFFVTFYGVSQDKALAKSVRTRSFDLRVL